MTALLAVFAAFQMADLATYLQAPQMESWLAADVPVELVAWSKLAIIVVAAGLVALSRRWRAGPRRVLSLALVVGAAIGAVGVSFNLAALL